MGDLSVQLVLELFQTPFLLPLVIFLFLPAFFFLPLSLLLCLLSRLLLSFPLLRLLPLELLGLEPNREKLKGALGNVYSCFHARQHAHFGLLFTQG